MSVDAFTVLIQRSLRNRFTAVIFLLVVLLLVVMGVDQFYVRYVTSHWQSISATEEQRLRDDVQSRFEAYQKETLQFVEQTAGLPTLRSEYSDSDRTALIGLFEIVKQNARPDLSLEVYNRHKQIISWAGSRGPSVDSAQFQLTSNSFVLQGPIYSYVVVTVPITGVREVQGYVVGKRLLNVNYPINNRFINDGAFATTFSSGFDILPEFDFSFDAKPSQDGRTLSIELRNVNRAPVGFAYLQRPVLSTRVDEIHHQTHRVANVILIIILCLFIYKIAVWTRRGKNVFVKVTTFSIALWVLRDRKSTRLNSSHIQKSRMPSSA